MAESWTDPHDAERLELFRALGDPSRLALLANLAAASGPLTVTEASTCCGMHLSGASRHLAKLAAAGVVRAERHGREVRYGLEAGRLAAVLRDLADTLEHCCAQQSAAHRGGATT